MANGHEPEWDRREFPKCMAWVGTGAAWTMTVEAACHFLIR